MNVRWQTLRKNVGDGEYTAAKTISDLSPWSTQTQQNALTMKRKKSVKLWIVIGLIFSASLIPNSCVTSPASSWLKHRLLGLFDIAGYDHGWLKRQDLWAQVVDANTEPEDVPKDEGVMNTIPQYVLDYAPLVHLYSEENFWPCDIAEHLSHMTPELNYTPIHGRQYTNLSSLDELNEFDKGRHVFLTSNDNVEERPDWLGGEKNIPDDFLDEDRAGRASSKYAHGRGRSGGRSDAPAVLLAINKGNGVVDAFWFYFYSYNLGNRVLNIRWGNHVGDWEHTLIRFQHGKPKLIFFSEHNFGSAYSYDAVEKIGKRVGRLFSISSSLISDDLQPVSYSATGTHAMYATPGAQPYVLPLGLLHDQTDRGPLWDPALNSHTYTYDHLTETLRASNMTPHAPTRWFYFNGHWGDKFYPLSDDRQYGLLGEYHYVNGPLGPRFKNLGRRKVCQGRYTDPCIIKYRLDDDEVRVASGVGEGEDWPDEPDMRPPRLA